MFNKNIIPYKSNIFRYMELKAVKWFVINIYTCVCAGFRKFNWIYLEDASTDRVQC